MEIKQLFKEVADFQIATDQEVNSTPTLLEKSYELLRFNLMKEENKEYLEATLEKDLVEVFDACVDMMYVLAGTINSHGLGDVFLEGFNLVHKNNMSKVVNGKVLRDENGKVKKPEGFVPVDLTFLIK